MYVALTSMARTWAGRFAELGADQDPLFVSVNCKAVRGAVRELWIVVSKQLVAHDPGTTRSCTRFLAELFAARPQRITAPTLVARKSALSENVRKQ